MTKRSGPRAGTFRGFGSAVLLKSRLRPYSRSPNCARLLGVLAFGPRRSRPRALVAAILHPLRCGVLGLRPFVLRDRAPALYLVVGELSGCVPAHIALGTAGCDHFALAGGRILLWHGHLLLAPLAAHRRPRADWHSPCSWRR